MRNEVTLESKCIVQQNDSISCGVRVCIAADLICKPKTTTIHETNVALTAAYISDYRFWIAYDLYNNSTWADHRLVEIENSAICWQAPRLLNLGNSCWFNATIQATAAVIKQANRFWTNFSDETTTIKINESNDSNHLISLLLQLLSKKTVNRNVLEKALKFACEQCSFAYGTQQDPAEFFRRSSLISTLFERGLWRKFQSKIYDRCSHCDSITSDNEVEQTDLILLMYDCIADGDQLQKVWDKYTNGIEKRKCDSCDSTTEHTSKVVFQNLPDLLVVCLSRATFDKGLKKLSTPVTPFRELTINDAECRAVNTYVLSSVICHFGDNCDSGHFICYNIIHDGLVMEMDDNRISVKSLDEIQDTIRCSGYLFFFVRNASRSISELYSTDSDSDSTKRENLPKKLIKF